MSTQGLLTGAVIVLVPPVPVPGSFYAFADAIAHDAWTPKLGLEWRLRERTLAYVSRPDGFDLEVELLRGGYARTLTIAPNDDRAPRYAALERAARRAGAGLWGACPNAAVWAAGR